MPCKDKNTSLFSAEQIEKLLSTMKFQDFTVNSTIEFEQNDVHLIYVKRGKLQLNLLTDDGKEVIIFALRPGDLFVLDDSLKQTNILASEPSVIGWAKQSSVELVLKNEPELCTKFIRWQSGMLSFAMMKLRDLIMHGKQGAFASALIRLANTYGEPVHDGVRINLKITNEELAKLIGSTRETVSRMIREYKAQQVISYDGRRIVIRNREFLRCQHQCLSCPPGICRI